MRGKGTGGFGDRHIRRITPAYAGKSFAYAEALPVAEDHPRLCGEKSHPLERAVYRQGSPPPMRGKGRRFLPLKCRNGITPAYAGKSACSSPDKPYT